MAKKFAFSNPLEQEITNGGSNWKVIGVVKDFHFESFKEEIRPLCLVIGKSTAAISLKVNTTDMSNLVQKLNSSWNIFSPNQPIQYDFLDERFAAMYDNVERTRSIFISFALLAIIIACLGLFALSAFMAEQRSKEISIRKVLGASTAHVLGVMTQNFLVLIFTSLLLSIPIAWYGMQRWLDDFVYRIEISWEVFVFAGLSTLLIALLTVSYQAFRTASIAPAEALRN